jgi:hypothetical protein
MRKTAAYNYQTHDGSDPKASDALMRRKVNDKWEWSEMTDEIEDSVV